MSDLKKIAESVGFLGWTKPEERDTQNEEWINFILNNFVKNPYFLSVDDWNLEKDDWDDTSRCYFKNQNALKIFIALSKVLQQDKELAELSSELGGISHVIFSKFPLKCCIRAKVDNSLNIEINRKQIPNTWLIEISIPSEGITRVTGNIKINGDISNNGEDLIMKRKKVLDLSKEDKITVTLNNASNLIDIFFENNTNTIETSLGKITSPNEITINQQEFGSFLRYILRNLIYFFSIARKILQQEEIKEIVYIPARGFIFHNKEMVSGGITIWVTKDTNYCLEKVLIVETIWSRRVSIWDWARKSQSHALRSAVAAIMARNMSHNIGSHVLNYLSNPEELDNLWII